MSRLLSKRLDSRGDDHELRENLSKRVKIQTAGCVPGKSVELRGKLGAI